MPENHPEPGTVYTKYDPEGGDHSVYVQLKNGRCLGVYVDAPYRPEGYSTSVRVNDASFYGKELAAVPPKPKDPVEELAKVLYRGWSALNEYSKTWEEAEYYRPTFRAEAKEAIDAGYRLDNVQP